MNTFYTGKTVCILSWDEYSHYNLKCIYIYRVYILYLYNSTNYIYIVDDNVYIHIREIVRNSLIPTVQLWLSVRRATCREHVHQFKSEEISPECFEM